MTLAEPLAISVAVEGEVDGAVACKLITHVGGLPGTIYVKKGKDPIRQRIAGYNHAAKHNPWLVLVDLDRDFDCAPSLCHAWLPSVPGKNLCFRVAVRAVEAWLMADPAALAKFLGIARNKIATDPERLDDPKTCMVNLARSSRRRDIREDMVPGAESGRRVGPAYSSRLTEFVVSHWRPDVAAQTANSLRRTMKCLTRLVEAHA